MRASSLSLAITRLAQGSAAWSPLALWPDGIATPGMWISPRDLTSQWQDYTGTTPVSVPGTVADSANPVGLALDIRAGAPVPGTDLVTNGDFSSGLTGWTQTGTNWSASGGGAVADGVTSGGLYQVGYITAGKTYLCEFDISGTGAGSLRVGSGGISHVVWSNSPGHKTARVTADAGTFLYIQGEDGSGSFSIDNISVKEVPGIHMFQSTSAARPLLSAYDGQTLGPGDTYDATGYPVFQLYDGVDDGMATASFAAGTLTSGMDCLIAVRRDSAAATYLISDTGSRGFFEWESGGTSRPDVSAGTPTYYVDGVAVTATKGALFTALTAGDWHILEARGLDLSAWTKVEVSSLASYRLNGPRGDIMLYPSTASTEDKDAARQWLADYYGVTLP